MTERAMVPAPLSGMPEGVATMPGANGGTLRRGGPGRMRKSLRRLQIEAQQDLARALKVAQQMMADEQLKPRDRLDAMEFIRRCSGIDKQKPEPTKRSTFVVLRATGEEMAATLAKQQEGTSPAAATP
jgi:hypothetical protein